MVSMAYETSMRVNGALLPIYTGQKVVLAGTVNQVDPSGTAMMVKASDGKMVTVTLRSPLQENVEGMVEIHGVGQGQQILCENYVTFPQMPAEDFDAAMYDEAVKLIQSVPENPWKGSDM